MRRALFIFLLIITAVCQGIFAANPKESVAIVKPTPSEEELAGLSDISMWLAHQELYVQARRASSYKNVVTGSGVAIISPDGTEHWLLTNRHVIGFASYATVVVEDSIGQHAYDSCRVLGMSMKTDLAVLLLPDSCPLRPLPLASKIWEEGTPVMAAGFPGLLGEPTWQLTEGVISNNHMISHELPSDSLPNIQHTAPIDHGNSGGPLLVEHEGNLEIVGINTWGVTQRDRVAISIPVEQVHEMLTTMQNRTTDKQFLHLLETDYKQAAQLITLPFLHENYKTNILTAMYATMPDSIKKDIANASAYPIEPVTTLVAYYLQKLYQQMPDPSQAKLTWCERQGMQALETIDVGEDKKLDKRLARTAKKTEQQVDNGIGAPEYGVYETELTYTYFPYAPTWNNRSDNNMEVAASITFNGDYFLFGFDAKCKMQSGTSYKTKETFWAKGPLFGIHFGGQLPIGINNTWFIPRAMIGMAGGALCEGYVHYREFSGNATKWRGQGQVYFKAGWQNAFPIEDKMITIGAYYSYSINLSVGNDWHGAPFKLTDGVLMGQHGASLALGYRW